MASFNKVIIMGNITRDPELMQTKNGTSICRFSVAVNRSYNSQDGSTRDETCFVEVDSFGRTAENIAKFFNKGKPILIEGRLRQDSWEDKQTGQRRSRIRIVAENLQLLGSRQGGYAGQQDGGYGGRQESSHGQGGYGGRQGGYNNQGGGYGQNNYGGGQSSPRSSYQQQTPPPMPPEEDDDIPF